MLCGCKDNVFIYAFVVGLFTKKQYAIPGWEIFGKILGSLFGSFCSVLFHIIFLSLSEGALLTDHNTDDIRK